MDRLTLSRVLQTNAFTSAIGGAVAALVPGWLDGWLDTGRPGWVRVVGIGLILFAAAVGLGSRLGGDRLRSAAQTTSVADGLWVVASIVTVAAGWYSGAGSIMVGVVAVAVGFFCIAQLVLASRSGTTRASAALP
ncbi:MAG: hypothetical protein KDB21_04185 [Acidimicrobiales bacterium]|nr:hypothetical protein [Acidimicrobiales bacterium]